LINLNASPSGGQSGFSANSRANTFELLIGGLAAGSDQNGKKAMAARNEEDFVDMSE